MLTLNDGRRAGPTAYGKAPATIRVAVVDGDASVRRGLRALIEGTRGFACLGAYDGGNGFLGPLEACAPDVVLMDLCGTAAGGVEIVRQLRRLLPATELIVFTPDDDDALIFESLCAGAKGCLVKSTPPVKILEAIQEVHEGGSPISSTIASRVVGLFRKGWVRTPVVEGLSLTPREKEVLRGLAEGRSYKEIAADFSTSVNTVRFHIRNLYEKLEAGSQAEAVAKGLRMGLI